MAILPAILSDISMTLEILHQNRTCWKFLILANAFLNFKTHNPLLKKIHFLGKFSVFFLAKNTEYIIFGLFIKNVCFLLPI